MSRGLILVACLLASVAPVGGATAQAAEEDRATLGYRAVFLTEAGHTLAQRCRERHRIVRDFLIALGIDPATAESDAEGIEHHVSDETLTAFIRHLRPAAGESSSAQ